MSLKHFRGLLSPMQGLMAQFEVAINLAIDKKRNMRQESLSSPAKNDGKLMILTGSQHSTKTMVIK